jgi:hypothetical protein
LPQKSRRRPPKSKQADSIPTAEKTSGESEPPSLEDILPEVERAIRDVPLFITWPPSEFDRLCKKFGKPIDLGIPIDRRLMDDFRRYSVKHRPHQVIPILRLFAKGHDETTASRHYPWAAFAVGQYAFEIEQFARDKEAELEPKQMLELFERLASLSKELIAELSTCQGMAYRLFDPTSPTRRGHLAWLNAFFGQAIGGHPTADLENYEITDDFQIPTLIKYLAHLQGAAMEAPKYFDEKLVARKPGKANPALRNFIDRSSRIWRSMTGRIPSANKVHTESGENPDFVSFVRELAKVGRLAVPTRRQVETSLQQIKARISP